MLALSQSPAALACSRPVFVNLYRDVCFALKGGIYNGRSTVESFIHKGIRAGAAGKDLVDLVSLIR